MRALLIGESGTGKERGRARDSISVEVRVQRESAEREHILRALDESSWNVSGAARALGMERTNLHKRIRALGLTRGT